MKYWNYFTLFEKLLWTLSTLAIVLAFVLSNSGNWLSFVSSLIGVTLLIFIAKGNPIGQLLTIIFSVFYGIISYSFAYYGEMVTYLGMTAPMALFALISWLRHPFGGNRSEVTVNRITKKEVAFMIALTAVVTAGFYFILSALHTANIIPSTLSVATSFMAVYLTFRRNPYYALAYAANDLILIILWALASLTDRSYISMLVCFVVFFVNDVYGFVNWKRMERRQMTTGQTTRKSP